MDFYLLLGLDQQASTADIKRAYRRLARRYHPGINPGDRAAEAMYQRIAEAYETLVDPERRQRYDAAGSAPSEGAAEPPPAVEFAGFDFTVTAQGAQASTFTELFADVLHPAPEDAQGKPEVGADIHAALTVSFLEAVRGAPRQVVVTRQDVCGACRGSGHVRTTEGRCVHCHGSGRVRWARGHMVFAKACGPCHGSGRQRHQRCAICGGHGRIVRSDAVPVDVPAGVTDGARLRVAERGHAGRNGGRTGDLYVSVNVQAHPLFRREGDDLHLQLPIAVHEAVLGARVEVPTLDGPIKMRIPPGTQAGHRFRVSGRGVRRPHGAGDLVVEVKLVLPPVVDERSRELIREFGRLNHADVRRDLQA